MSQPTEPRPTQARLTRRHALGGVAGVGLGLPLLAACGGGDETATGPAPTSTAPSADSGSSSGSSPEPAAAFASTDEVPVGGGAIFADEGVVVTQPTEGEFLGFSITCSHQGCPVDSVTESGINCPCHGSTFDLSSGEPTAGPASAPLGTIALSIKGTEISRA